jgi:hypothetical protein
MKKESIADIVDKNIHESYLSGSTHNVVIDLLNAKMTNLRTILSKDRPDIVIDHLMDVEDWDSISPIRARYTIFYIKHSKKRIQDITWIEKNRSKFTKFSNVQIFSLIKLKDKLLPTFPPKLVYPKSWEGIYL